MTRLVALAVLLQLALSSALEIKYLRVQPPADSESSQSKKGVSGTTQSGKSGATAESTALEAADKLRDMPKEQKPEVPGLSLAVPGVWMTDAAEQFLFLPLHLPLMNGAKDTTAKLASVKVFSNGAEVLVLVTKSLSGKEESHAVKKFKFILETLKDQVSHNTDALAKKLAVWESNEDDPEVLELIASARQSLAQLKATLKGEQGKAASVSVPLELFAKQAATHLQGMLGSALLQTNQAGRRNWAETDVVRESFSVEVPTQLSAGGGGKSVFCIQTSATEIMVVVPWKVPRLAGELPRLMRVPVYTMQGTLLTAPSQDTGHSLMATHTGATHTGTSAAGLDVSF